MVLKKEAKRLGVFVFYDREGIVDDYVLFLLQSLKEATDDLIIVSNCSLSTLEKEKMSFFTQKITIRENVGLDAGAFKTIYDEYQNYFKNFDELLLLNDTFYGPFVPFKTICDTMAKRNVDFWGLSANFDSPDGFGYLPDNMIHSHIQTFFIAFRKNVLNSQAFHNYWKNYVIYKRKNFQSVVTKHEIVFTHYLEQAGFKWDIYTNLEKYHSTVLEENFNTYAYASYDLIKNCNCPFIKRKNFVFEKKDVLFLSDGEDNKKSLEYIKENDLYDVDKIWNNLIRLYKPEDLYYGLNLNYIIDEKKDDSNKYVLVFLLEEERYVDCYIEFIKTTAIKNILVFSDNLKIKKQLENENIKVTKKEEFVKEKYDTILVLKDADLKTQKIFLPYEISLKNCILNGFSNDNYIKGVQNVFLQNQYIGLVVLPSNLHSDYFGNLTKKEEVLSANSNCCWLKSSLFDWKIIETDSFVQDYIKRIEKKYLVAKIFNKKAVQNILLNQEYILQKTYQILGNFNGKLNNISGLLYYLKHTKRVTPFLRKVKVVLYKLFNKIVHIFF